MHTPRTLTLLAQLRRFVSATVCAATLVFLAGGLATANAQETAKRTFDLPADAAATTLKMFSQQSGRALVVDSDLVRGIRTNVVKGEFTVEEAMDLLLMDTGLVAAKDAKSGAYTVKKEGLSPNAQRAIANSDRPSRNDRSNIEATDGGGKPIVLDTFEVFGKKTLNMDIQRTRDDVQPYIVFDSKAIESSGASNIGEFLRKRLTADPVGVNNAQSFSVDGNSSTINLRGLGTGQTLILIDGHRTPSYYRNGIAAQADLNALPLAAIERVEILANTASGIYGGDATGGVVNVILKRSYRGGTVSANSDQPFAAGGGDGDRADVSWGSAFNDGKTSIMLVASYSRQSQLLAGERPFFERSRNAQAANNPASIYNFIFPPLGETTNIRALSGNLVLKPTYGGTSLNSPITFIPVGYSGIATGGSTELIANAGKYNLKMARTAQTGGAKQALLMGSVTKSVRSTLRHDFADDLSGFVELSASTNQSNGLSNTLSSSFLISSAAPSNPFNQTVRVSTPTFGADQEWRNSIDSYRLLAGLIWKFSPEWQAEADITFDRSCFEYSSPTTGILSTGTTAVSNGTIDVLRDTNLFPVDFSSFVLPRTEHSRVNTDLIDLTIRSGGPAFEFASRRVTLSTSVEYRELRIGDSRQLTAPGEGSIYPSRRQSVTSAYVETTMPIFSSRARGKDAAILDMQLAARADYYRTVGANTIILAGGISSGPKVEAVNAFRSLKPTAGLRLRPFQGFILRGSYGEGFLPPSVSQLVPNAPQFVPDDFGLVDPKRGNQPVVNYTLLFGGNPALRPESSESYSLGFVLEPSFAKGLRLSVDWVRIDKRNNIRSAATFGQSDLANEDLIPGLVTRNTDPSSFGGFPVGPVIQIDGRLTNIARQQVEALDYSASFDRLFPGFGRVDVSIAATFQLFNRTQTAPGAAVIDAVGLQGGAELAANGQVTWTRGAWRFGWASRYLDNNWFNTQRTVNANTATAQYGGYYLHDINVEYTLKKAARWEIRLQCGANNVFNEKGDIFGSSNGYDGRISPLLAQFWARAELKF